MKKYIDKWKEDYTFKTLVGSLGSFLLTVAFALYNGFLGIWYSSVWNSGICVYYLFLSLIRGMILLTEKRNLKSEKIQIEACRKKTFWQTSFLLLIMHAALTIPISLMVYNKRPVSMGLIPAIAMATYTTYKITMASVNIKRMKKSDNILVRELRTINFIDALVSVLTLQNTLIVVNTDDDSHSMFILSAISSAAILLMIVAVSISSIRREMKRK